MNEVLYKSIGFLKRNRNLIFQFIKRETINRYKGSQLGFAWTILTPLLMLLVYTFVFGEVFQAKWKTDSTSTIEFAIIIFCGLSTFNIFSEVVARSPYLITSNSNYVKKIVFPLETFPIITLGSALVSAVINYLLVIVFQAVLGGGITWTVLLLPIVILPVVMFSLGLSWFLSSLGVFLRDIGQVIGIAVQALMLLSPILYSVDIIPERFRWFYNLNPITHFVEDVRSIIIWGHVPALKPFLIECAVCGVVAVLGLIWFRKTKQGFADVL
ncbi:ABC transporter permease [Paenibacillus sp. NPDC058174]|uniref:ABC transporter permease n=1 Tax=Paenibacillus sp. NPDC058174 TaxID=3346366 RepID=UPI0036DA70E9